MQKSGMGNVLLVAKTGVWQQFVQVLKVATSGVMGGFFAWQFLPVFRNWQNPTETTIVGIGMFAIFGLGFLSLALYMLWEFLYAFGHQLTVYEGGIKHQYMGKSEEWVWDELDALSYYNLKVQQQMGFNSHDYTLKIRRKDGKILHINKIYKDFMKLGDLLLKLTTDAWIRRDFLRLKAGETLSYGNLKVNRDGIGQGKKFIPWTNIERIDKLPTSFSIVPFGERRRLFHIGSSGIHGVPLKVWNAHVLLSLTQSLAQL